MSRSHRWTWIGLAATAATAIVVGPVSATGQEPTAEATRRERAARQIPLQRSATEALRTTFAFRQPEDWGFGRFHELTIRTAYVTIPGAGENGGPRDFEVLTYNGRSHGPIIRALRGETFSIRVRNHLRGPETPEVPDRPNGLGTTNLHTHGLHVSPADPGDNIYRCIAPGQSHTFTYTVPADHPSGTFWYHPHRHGSVAYQISNGLAGALIVEGSDEDDIKDLEEVPEIAAARDQVFLFQQYNAVVGTDEVARIDGATIYNPATVDPGYPRTWDGIDLRPKPGYDPNNPDPPIITINGVVTPEIHLRPGEVQRWRMIHAGIEQEQLLVWTDAQENPIGGDGPDPDPAKIQFLEIAKDGLSTGDLKVNRQIALYPGYRLDVLVRAPMLAQGQREAVYLVKKVEATPTQALRTRPGRAGAAISDPAVVLKVVVRGRPRPMRLPTKAELAPYRAMVPVEDPELTPATPPFDAPITFSADDASLKYLIQNNSFHNQVPAKIPLGSVQEWTLHSDLKSHPFHIHVNSFQVKTHRGPGGEVLAGDVGDWKDTLFIEEGHTYTIRSRFKDFTGQTVFHCHILDHEDQGMMMPIEFHRGTEPLPPQELCHAAKPGPAGAAGPAPATKLSPASDRAPALRLPESGATTRDLAAFRGRGVILVFFKGEGCGHCVGRLRELVRETRGLDTPIVAVSARTVADRASALEALGVVATDRFHLLVDADHRAFRDFDCFDGGPLHGLFVIDREGVIRARYRGTTPFDDPREVVNRVRALGPRPDATASR